jgi:hypothetical protein
MAELAEARARKPDDAAETGDAGSGAPWLGAKRQLPDRDQDAGEGPGAAGAAAATVRSLGLGAVPQGSVDLGVFDRARRRDGAVRRAETGGAPP